MKAKVQNTESKISCVVIKSGCSSALDGRTACEVWRSCASIRVSDLDHRCRVMTDMCPIARLFLWFTHKTKKYAAAHQRYTQED